MPTCEYEWSLDEPKAEKKNDLVKRSIYLEESFVFSHLMMMF
jgi:hypothetical protein